MADKIIASFFFLASALLFAAHVDAAPANAQWQPLVAQVQHDTANSIPGYCRY